YPHELSGGQRQRVAIARALVMNPTFVVADEPTSMLDVSIRISIMELMTKLARELGVSYLYITHDLAVARYMCDRIAVMYLGKIVEIGPTEEVLARPRHPYTRALLSAVPVPDPTYRRTPVEIKGGISKAINPAPECRFIERRRVLWVVAFPARRLAWAVITLAIYLTAVFFFVQWWVPIAFSSQFALGGGQADAAARFGLDRPLPERYAEYMCGLLTGDL